MFSKTKDKYKDLLEEFKEEFNQNKGNPYLSTLNSTPNEIQDLAIRDLERQALKYTISQQLLPYKTEIVHTQTNRHFYCSTTTTSRFEGAHVVLKRQIRGSSKDLKRVQEATQLAIKDQLNEIRVKNAQKLSSIPLRLLGVLYYQVISKITHTGLYVLQRQLEHVKRQEQHKEEGRISTICTRSFSISIGMPCQHMIKERLANNQRKSNQLLSLIYTNLLQQLYLSISTLISILTVLLPASNIYLLLRLYSIQSIDKYVVHKKLNRGPI